MPLSAWSRRKPTCAQGEAVPADGPVARAAGRGPKTGGGHRGESEGPGIPARRRMHMIVSELIDSASTISRWPARGGERLRRRLRRPVTGADLHSEDSSQHRETSLGGPAWRPERSVWTAAGRRRDRRCIGPSAYVSLMTEVTEPCPKCEMQFGWWRGTGGDWLGPGEAIAGKPSDDLPPGTWNSKTKQSGLKE